MNTSNTPATDIQTPSTSESLPQTTPAETATSSHATAMHNLVVGGLWCAGGILVTALTYNAVAESGGHYVIAWGAILFGGIQFLKGLGEIGS